MVLRKLVVPTVFIWYWRNSSGGIDLSAGGRSVCSRLQLNKRWCAVCMGFSGQLQCGVIFLKTASLMKNRNTKLTNMSARVIRTCTHTWVPKNRSRFGVLSLLLYPSTECQTAHWSRRHQISLCCKLFHTSVSGKLLSTNSVSLDSRTDISDNLSERSFALVSANVKPFLLKD